VGSFGNGAVVSAANIATAANAFTITFPSGVILIESTFAFDLVTTDAVPLPPGIALLLAGIAGIALMRRRAV
ncbi:MAG: VPLPA-CTERM sorting domain-containing protein, partial [Pseudomonadota bacterium]